MSNDVEEEEGEEGEEPEGLIISHTAWWHNVSKSAHQSESGDGKMCRGGGRCAESLVAAEETSMKRDMGTEERSPDRCSVAVRHKQMKTNCTPLWCSLPVWGGGSGRLGILEKCQVKHTSMEARRGCQAALMQPT